MRCFDLQVNGAFGVDFSSATLTELEFMRCVESILEAGVSRFLPTIITSDMATYRRNLPMMLEAIERANLSYELPGFHLEGPFISDKAGAVGAHTPEYVQKPTPEALRTLNEIAGNRILMMTFAAEVEGAVETIAEAKNLGIVASLGHQLANSEEMAKASAECLTHLGNGIPNMIPRHHNAIWSGLANDDLTAMIITDGHHLPPEVIKAIIRVKGADRVIVTSDASLAANLPPGRYHIFDNDAILEENGKLHNPEKECLVGSAMLMPRCIEFLKTLNLLDEQELEKVCWLNQHKLLNIKE